MPLWRDEPKFELQVLGRFLWKLTATLLVALLLFAIIGLIVEAIFDLPGVEIVER